MSYNWLNLLDDIMLNFGVELFVYSENHLPMRLPNEVCVIYKF